MQSERGRGLIVERNRLGHHVIRVDVDQEDVIAWIADLQLLCGEGLGPACQRLRFTEVDEEQPDQPVTAHLDDRDRDLDGGVTLPPHPENLPGHRPRSCQCIGRSQHQNLGNRLRHVEVIRV